MAWRSFLGDGYALPNRVMIFDTTLRDGEQTPGVSLKIEEKIAIAEALADLGVDVIEAGFPVVSTGEFETIKRISKLGLPSKVCVLSRCDKVDIERAAETGAEWIHVFIATSESHMKNKLRMTREEVLRRAVEMTEYAKSFGMTVHFSAEDATRSDPEFLIQVYKAVKEAGADSIDIPDTVGFAIPPVMRYLAKRAKEATGLPVAVHCHDDMGLATANTLAGIEGGAEMAHVTVNGIGERAGNTSMEEVVVALKFLYGVETNIDLSKINKVSRLVAKLTGMLVPKNKAIVGDNAFTHESGIHVHGVLNDPYTYEPIMPEVVGKSRRIILGKHSGIHGLDRLLREHGYNLSKEQLSKVLSEIKSLGDSGVKVSEQLLLSIVGRILGEEVKPLVNIRNYVQRNTTEGSECVVELEIAGEAVSGKAVGASQISAAIEATRDILRRIVNDLEIVDYNAYISPYDERHPTEAEVVIRVGDNTYIGRGIHSNVALAIVLAIAGAVSQHFHAEKVGKKEVVRRL